jgi:hypothetical protein
MRSTEVVLPGNWNIEWFIVYDVPCHNPFSMGEKVVEGKPPFLGSASFIKLCEFLKFQRS